MAGYFAPGKGSAGKFTFNLKSGNHQTILTSEAYESREAALGGIESVMKNSGDNARYERKEAKNGQPYFVLKAANGQVVGRSELYATAAAMEKGIASVKENGGSQDVRDAS